MDFDGVLNSVKYTESIADDEYPKLSVEWWAKGLDPKPIRLLNEIVDRTGAQVVVSSSWRIGFGPKGLGTILQMRGFTGRVIDRTVYLAGQPRSDEIEEWLNAHEVESYVILDDDDDAEIDGHFVQTHIMVGLTKEDVEKAVVILGERDG